jgi:hypothetical protein
LQHGGEEGDVKELSDLSPAKENASNAFRLCVEEVQRIGFQSFCLGLPVFHRVGSHSGDVGFVRGDEVDLCLQVRRKSFGLIKGKWARCDKGSGFSRLDLRWKEGRECLATHLPARGNGRGRGTLALVRQGFLNFLDRRP